MAKGKKKNLVIVESPAKAKTINKYLGPDYEVVASKGHVRDLPKSRFGIDIENGWMPTYRALKDRKDVLAILKKQAAGADMVYLAPDPDREGEAIAWHLKESLGPQGRQDSPGHLQRNHQDRGQEGVRQRRRHRHGPRRRPGSAPLPRPRRRLQAQPAAEPATRRDI